MRTFIKSITPREALFLSSGWAAGCVAFALVARRETTKFGELMSSVVKDREKTAELTMEAFKISLDHIDPTQREEFTARVSNLIEFDDIMEANGF